MRLTRALKKSARNWTPEPPQEVSDAMAMILATRCTGMGSEMYAKVKDVMDRYPKWFALIDTTSLSKTVL